MDEVSGGDRTDAQMAQIAAYFTNPLLEVDADGSPVEAIGFEEWLEGLESAGATVDESALEREITRRASAITWESWVGLWSTLSEFDGDVVVEPAGDGLATFLAERTVDDHITSIELLANASTLAPEEATYEVRSVDVGGSDAVVAYEWSFDWTACDGARSAADIVADAPGSVAATAGFETITVGELPPQALDTLALIEAGGPFPYPHDGAVFENREGLLPDQPFGYYQEYTVETPGSAG